MNISYRILGYARVRVDEADLVAFLNLCMREGLPYLQGNTPTSFTVRLSRLRSAQALCEREKISLYVDEIGGLPMQLYRRRHRVGLMIGIVFAIALVFLSRQFIWRVDVVGNTGKTSSEICEMLKSYGVAVGSYIPHLDTDRIENDILIGNKGISWIAVNLSGNIATVELRETAFGSDGNKNSPANLVANKDGIIEYVNVMSGNTVVRSGDMIKEGQLLVSGIFDSNTGEMRFTRAQGKVYARTSEEIYIKVPYHYEGKVYTGEQYYDKYLNFFGFSIKISKNSRNEDGFYDKISIVENIGFPDGSGAPITVTTDSFHGYKTCSMTRTPAEAEELAYFELSQRLSELAEDSVLLRKVIIPEIHDDFFSLRCVIVCIEDIARVQEFEADLTPAE